MICPPRAVDNRSKRDGEDEDHRDAGRLAHFSPGQVQTEMLSEREVAVVTMTV